MTRGTMATAAGMVALLALAGCGGSSSPARPATQASQSTTTGGGAPDPQSLVSQLGCNDASPEPSPELFVREAVNCTYYGDDITINTFSSASTEKSWTDTAKNFGGIIVEGNGWVIEGLSTQDHAQSAVNALGGKIAT